LRGFRLQAEDQRLMKLTTYPSATPRAALVLAHGAGAGQKSPFMVQFSRGMAQRGISTATFDFPYITAGRKVPDRAPVLEAAWREALEAARAEFAGLRLTIGGKSMGGRMASHIAAQGVEGVDGLVFLGYPLHPPGKPEQRRDAHLPAIKERMLFVQGTRDAFGTAEEIAALLPTLQRAELHTVTGGDHSFKVPGRNNNPLEGIMDAVADFIVFSGVAPQPPRSNVTS
jgi:predicted alpha/beta-hydrolase family hydrolase